MGAGSVYLGVREKRKTYDYEKQKGRNHRRTDFANFEKIIAEVYKSYQKSLRVNEALDFDDLILLPLDLINNAYL